MSRSGIILPIGLLAWICSSACAQSEAVAVREPEPPILLPIDRTCGNCVRYSGGLEYLVFAIRDGASPQVLHTLPGNFADLVLAAGNAIPPDSVRPVFGRDGLNYGTFSGIRLDLAADLPQGIRPGLDASFLQLEQRSDSFNTLSGGSSRRAALDARNPDGAGRFLFLSLPDGSQSTAFSVENPLHLFALDFNAHCGGYRLFSDRTLVHLGVRYFDLRETVRVDGTSISGSSIALSTDRYRAVNQFYGGQIGWTSIFDRDRWSLSLCGKFALGAMNQSIRLDDESIRFDRGSIRSAGGFESAVRRTRLAFMPEAVFKLSYRVAPGCRFNLGYDLFTISDIQRAAEAIRPLVQSLQTPLAPGPGIDATRATLPTYGFHTSDFWAQGVTIGLSLVF